MLVPMLPAPKVVPTTQTFRRVLTPLLVCDLTLITFHLLRAYLNDTPYTGFLLDPRWSLELDRTYPELFQYVKAGLTALALLWLYLQRHALTYLGWSLAFVYILVDDAFSLHERFTVWLSGQAALPDLAGLGVTLYAATLLWAAVGLVLLGLLAAGYRNRSTRRLSRQLAYVLLAFFLFGAVLDGVHLLAEMNGLSRVITFAIGTLEDGGEVVVASFALAVAVAANIKGSNEA